MATLFGVLLFVLANIGFNGNVDYVVKLHQYPNGECFILTSTKYGYVNGQIYKQWYSIDGSYTIQIVLWPKQWCDEIE